MIIKNVTERNPDAVHFEVAGAGEIQFDGPSRTGTARGLSIGVSWGHHQYAGGVIDNAEIRRLVEYLNAHLQRVERGI